MGTRNVQRCKCGIFLVQMPYLTYARLAQSAERKALNLVVVGSSPTVGVFVTAHTSLEYTCTYICIYI